MLTKQQLIEALRMYGDIAQAGDKYHWGVVMHEAAKRLAQQKDIAPYKCTCGTDAITGPP